MDDFLKSIRTLRESRKMTQSEAAVSCGVSLTMYQLWERGVSKPNPENRKKLEKLFMEN